MSNRTSIFRSIFDALTFNKGSKNTEILQTSNYSSMSTSGGAQHVYSDNLARTLDKPLSGVDETVITENHPLIVAPARFLADTAVGQNGVGIKFVLNLDRANVSDRVKNKVSDAMQVLNLRWNQFVKDCEYREDLDFVTLQHVALYSAIKDGGCFLNAVRDDDVLKINILPMDSLRSDITTLSTSQYNPTTASIISSGQLSTLNQKTLMEGYYADRGIVYDSRGKIVAYLFRTTSNGYAPDGGILEQPRSVVSHVYELRSPGYRRGEKAHHEVANYIAKYIQCITSLSDCATMASSAVGVIERVPAYDNSLHVVAKAASTNPSLNINSSSVSALNELSKNINKDQWTKSDYSGVPKGVSLVGLNPGEKLTNMEMPEVSEVMNVLSTLVHLVGQNVGIPMHFLMDKWDAMNYSGAKGLFSLFQQRVTMFQKKVLVEKVVRPVTNWFLDHQKHHNPELKVLFDFLKDNQECYIDIKILLPAFKSLSALEDEKAIDIQLKNGTTSKEAVVTGRGESYEEVLKSNENNKLTEAALTKLIIDKYGIDVTKSEVVAIDNNEDNSDFTKDANQFI